MTQLKDNILQKAKNIARIKVRDYNPVVLVLLMYLLHIALAPTIVWIAKVIGIKNTVTETWDDAFGDFTLTHMIIEVGFVGPIIETLLHQLLAYYLFSLIPFLKRNWGIIVIVGGVVFAVTHPYSTYHTIAILPFGCIIMFAYIVKKGKGGFWIAAAIHIINNLIEIAKMKSDGFF